MALHFMPELIPLSLLKRFHHEPRLAIAQRRSLWNESQMVVLPRDDGGPALQLFKPGSTMIYDFHSKGERGTTVVMDEQGFCNPANDTYAKPRIDIVSIGDSFTACVLIQPEQTWISQLGEISGHSVYNLGRSGIGPYAYLQILKRYGLQKNPGIVIMNIYEGNDLRDAIRYRQHVAAAEQGKQLFANASDRNDPREIDIDKLLGNGLLRNSYAVNFILAVSDKVYEAVKKVVTRIATGQMPEDVDFHYQFRFPDAAVEFNVQNADQSEVRFARQLKSGDIDFDAFDEALEIFADLARQQGFTPIISYSPSAYTAYADYVQFQDPSLQTLMPWFSQQQRSYLECKVESLGMRFIDLTASLQAAARKSKEKELLYNPANVHFNVSGNRVVAEALQHALRSYDLSVLDADNPVGNVQ